MEPTEKGIVIEKVMEMPEKQVEKVLIFYCWVGSWEPDGGSLICSARKRREGSVRGIMMFYILCTYEEPLFTKYYDGWKLNN